MVSYALPGLESLVPHLERSCLGMALLRSPVVAVARFRSLSVVAYRLSDGLESDQSLAVERSKLGLMNLHQAACRVDHQAYLCT